MAHPDTDIRYIKGIGETRANALNKLGIRTLEDLLSYFPRRWEDRTLERPIRELAVGEYACVRAMLAGDPTASRISGGRTLVKVRAVDDSGALDVAFFNQDYRRTSLHKGETYIFYGKVEGDLLRRRMTNPVVEPEGRQLLTGRIMPIYPLAAGVSQTLLAKAMRQGLDACRDLLPDVLPDEVRRTYHLCYTGYAYENIHFPDSPEALDIARRRLVFEELFVLACGLQLLRSRRETGRGPACKNLSLTPFYDALPFALTGAQRRAVEQAVSDMTSGRVMNRLCQGDVGSGKTMVAAACVWFAARNGWQSALMAPTEILARQHYENLAPLFARFGLHCALLTGSTRVRERRAILAGLADGTVDLCIGTHALLTEDVQYAVWDWSSPTSSTASAWTSGPPCPKRRTRPTCWCCPPPPSPARWPSSSTAIWTCPSLMNCPRAARRWTPSPWGSPTVSGSTASSASRWPRAIRYSSSARWWRRTTSSPMSGRR